MYLHDEISQVQNDEESITKRARIDSEQSNDPQFNLADIYRKFAEVHYKNDLQLIGEGMYMPHIKRFIKFATCAEKAEIQTILTTAEGKPKAKFPTNEIADYYTSVWRKNMQRNMDKDDGVTLLLIEPINNPFAASPDYTWAGVLTEFTPENHKDKRALTRCHGMAPHLFYLAAQVHKMDCRHWAESIVAMPEYFRELASGTVHRRNTTLIRFHGANREIGLGTLIKAFAHQIHPTSSQHQFGVREMSDIIEEEGFYNINNILPYLTNNDIIVRSLDDVKPLPIEMTLPKKKPETPRLQNVTIIDTAVVVKQGLFAKASAPSPKNSDELNLILNEAASIIKLYPDGAFHYVVRCMLEYINHDGMQSAEARRIKIFFEQSARFISKAKITHWKPLLKHAMDSLYFGYSDIPHAYSLLMFYQDIDLIYKKSPSVTIEKILSIFYWLIINCTEIEQVNLYLDFETRNKFTTQFNTGFIPLQTLFLLFRSLTDKVERQGYLETLFTNNNYGIFSAL